MPENTFHVISPVDDSIYLERSFARPSEVEKALASSEKARTAWKATSLEERIAICRKAVRYFLDRAEEIGAELSWQMGRPLRYSPYEITKGFQDRAHYMMDIAGSSLADLEVGGLPGFTRFIRRDPLGVVFVLAPWNYPYLTSVNVVIPAILAGNTVILKHAQQTPRCAERYAEAFEQAGLPEGVFQYLHLTHTQVAGMIKDSRIAHIAFTGSVEGGKAIQKAIGQRFKTSGLELGGKDPAYVREDADLGYSVENLVDGAFFNSGQSCCGVERIYVHEARFGEFVEAFAALTRKYVLGSPLDPETTLGPMVRTTAAEFAKTQIAEAILQGAKALIDPEDFPAHQPDSPYLAPQVLIKVDHRMRVMKEESFAPVVGIIPVKDDATAIRYMNDSRYGLTASVWTSDAGAAVRIGDQLETGTCFMNRCDYLDPALAWTGVKDSGRGCTLSSLGYEALTRPKSFHLKVDLG